MRHVDENVLLYRRGKKYPKSKFYDVYFQAFNCQFFKKETEIGDKGSIIFLRLYKNGIASRFISLKLLNAFFLSQEKLTNHLNTASPNYLKYNLLLLTEWKNHPQLSAVAYGEKPFVFKYLFKHDRRDRCCRARLIPTIHI